VAQPGKVLWSEEKKAEYQAEAERKEQRRKQTPEPAHVKSRKTERSVPKDLVPYQPGYEESADDEEDVDANVSTAEQIHSRVKQHDGNDGQRPQAINLWTIPGGTRNAISCKDLQPR
jgi:hypothetical protein